VTTTTILATNQSGPYAFGAISPVTLAPGDYQLQAYGGQGNTNFNTGFTATPTTDPLTFDTLGGRLTEGTDYYNLGPGLATTSDAHFYASADFMASRVPEPATWAMMLLGAGLIGGGLRLTHRKNGLAPAAV